MTFMGFLPLSVLLVGGGLEPKIVCSCAFRGRPNGNSMQQKLEVSEKKIANCITQAYKDSMVLEIYETKNDGLH